MNDVWQQITDYAENVNAEANVERGGARLFLWRVS